MVKLKKVGGNHKRDYFFTNGVLFLMCISFSNASLAYIGPGLGIGTIGVVLGVIASIVLALFAVIWFPVKRLLKKRKESSNKVPKQSDTK